MLGLWIDQKLNFKHHIQVKREECKKIISLMQCIGTTNFGADRKSLLRILNTMLLPKLLYGAPIISRANDNDLSRLSPIYHQAIRIATGAFHSSPIESILSESGQLPLDLKITEQLILYSAKQTSRNIISPNSNLAIRATEKMESLSIPSTKVIIAPPNYDPPQRILGINLDITNISSSAEKKAHFEEIRHTKYQHHKHIYTDGSKTSQGTGCGIFSSNFETYTSLPNHLSIFSAEAFAIKKAIDTDSTDLLAIFSDSKSVLMAIQNLKSNHPWIDEIRKKILQTPGRIDFCWVPAHVNISGNENADKLAKKATTVPVSNDIATPYDDFKSLVRHHIRLAWERIWYRNTGHLREIKRNTSEWTSSYSFDRKESKAITRLRIGHTRLTHGHFARREPASNCPTCGTSLTVKHIIADCLKYDNLRKELNIAHSLFLALGDDTNELKKTVKFLTKTNLLNEI